MKQLLVFGLTLLAVAGSGCATRGYARRQAAKVDARVTQVQTQASALSDKHQTDFARIDERLTTTDNKLQAAATSAAAANANAAQANANAARADASAAQANASAARSEATIAQANANAARADAAAAQQRAVIAQNTPPPAPTSSEEAKPSNLPSTLPTTGSPLPLIGLSGLLLLGAGGALRLFCR
jgi:trimeric autotransporter adhesin